MRGKGSIVCSHNNNSVSNSSSSGIDGDNKSSISHPVIFRIFEFEFGKNKVFLGERRAVCEYVLESNGR